MIRLGAGVELDLVIVVVVLVVVMRVDLWWWWNNLSAISPGAAVVWIARREKVRARRGLIKCIILVSCGIPFIVRFWCVVMYWLVCLGEEVWGEWEEVHEVVCRFVVVRESFVLLIALWHQGNCGGLTLIEQC